MAARFLRLLASALVATLVCCETAPPPVGWPNFKYEGVVTDKAKMKYNPTNEFIFPSVFHASLYFDNPLAEWYLYYAPHDAPGGISLSYSNSLDGPWTEYANNPVIHNNWSPHYSVSHVSSPHAKWNEQTGKLFMYFHGENTVTRWSWSNDGIDFNYGGSAVTTAMSGSQVTETSYARVFTHTDPNSKYKYAMFFMGNEKDNRRRLRLAESVDGKTWVVDPTYLLDPGAEEQYQASGPNLWQWCGKSYLLYHGASGKSYARIIDKTLRNIGGTPIIFHQSSGSGNDTGRVASPFPVTWYGGESWFFYESGDRLGATIAWAKDPNFNGNKC
jgi:hypothetical protein